MRSASAFLTVVFITVGSVSGQCGGNGANAGLSTTPFVINSTLSVGVSGNPTEAFWVFVSSANAVLPVPGLGTVCIDVNSPLFSVVLAGIVPAAGNILFPVPIPNDPGLLVGAAFVQGVVNDAGFPGGIGLTQAYRVDFEAADSYLDLPVMSEPRALSSANLLPDGRVLIAGGGGGSFLVPIPSGTSNIYDPYTRTTNVGPTMTVARAFHTATTLDDGRVLLCGGVDAVAGTVTATCEIYDPATNSFAATASMTTARAAHTATLLQDGRVLVTGGTSLFLGTIGQILNASTASAAIWSPTTGMWTATANAMSSPRFQAAATRLNDGRVLITSGISGATSLFGVDIPTLTSSANYFTPASNSFSAAPSVPNAVVGHRTSILPNGNVFLSGGAQSVPLGAPTTGNATAIFNGSSWSSGPNLPDAVALHGQVVLQNGDLHIFGGLTGTLTATSASTSASRFDGTTLTTLNSLPVARGTSVHALLKSGTILIAGGADVLGVAVDAMWLYTPLP
ncbi:MAG: hypothetical protein CMJ83_06655 [Planctomycetes bacterium]|nr:hypothetical protein [Planctomycetota bacterium]